METRFLGRSGLKVSALGFGAGTFGGKGPLFSAWGNTDVTEARRMIDLSLDAGLTFFDTADVYSDGASESILGEALRGRRDRVILSSKTGLRLGEGANDAGTSRLRLLKAVDGNSVSAVRNRAIILMLLDCGLRVSEMCALDAKDVDIKGGWVRVREGKGWKERKVPIGGAVRRALWQYSKMRPQPMGGNKRYFLTEDGWQLPTERVRKMLIHYGHKAEVENVHPHRFRHSFALHFLRNGGDALTLRMLLGHTTLQMVSRYVQLAAIDLKAVHAKASPADHLRL